MYYISAYTTLSGEGKLLGVIEVNATTTAGAVAFAIDYSLRNFQEDFYSTLGAQTVNARFGPEIKLASEYLASDGQDTIEGIIGFWQRYI